MQGPETGSVAVSVALDGLRRTLSAYHRLVERRGGRGEDWPDFELVAVRVTTEELDLSTVDARSAAFRKVRDALDAHQGWARCQSALMWSGMTAFPDFVSAGSAMMAEWRIDDSRSVRISPSQANGFRAVMRTFSERKLGDDLPADGEFAGLCQRKTIIAHDRTGHEQLVYHVYWGVGQGQPHHEIRPIFDRFVGFDNGDA